MRRAPTPTLFPYTTLFRSVMEAIKLCRLDTPIIFIEARIKMIGVSNRSEERFSRNAETDLVCRLLLEKKKARRCQGSVEGGLDRRIEIPIDRIRLPVQRAR